MSEFDNSSQNPAWNEFLDVIPADYHEQVKPLLQKWDSGVNDRFSRIHNEYESWKPFQQSGVTPDQVDFALGVIQQMNSDPRSIFEALGDHHGFFVSEDDEDEDQEENSVYDPRLGKLEEGYNLLAEAWLSEQKAKADAQEDAALDRELSSLRKHYGEFDEEFVLMQMASKGMDTEDAVRSFFDFQDRLLTQSRKAPAPKVFGSGGTVPSGTRPSMKDKNSRQDYMSTILSHYFNQQ